MGPTTETEKGSVFGGSLQSNRMATEGNGGLGSSEEVREGQLMGPALERLGEYLMDDNIQNPWSSLEPYIRRLAREVFEHLAKSGPVMVGGSEILEVHMVDTRQKVETCVGRIERLETCLGRIERLETCLGRIERLEPCLGRIESEIKHVVPKLVPAMDGGRQSLKRKEGPDGRNLQLHCRTKLAPSFYTEEKVEEKVGDGVDGGKAIRVELIDKSTGNIVTSGPESRAKLDVVALAGDFNHEDDDDEWTPEEFENKVVKEREGKRPLLAGELKVSLKGGVGSLEDVAFTDNSSWIPCKKFRLGVGVPSGFCEGIRIREAKTNAFTVKEHRGLEYKKHHPPSWDDELWRLEKIGKDGPFLKKLNDKGIFKVEDFRRFLVRDSQALRKILGDNMPTKNWDALVTHAKTCPLNGKQYVYYDDDLDNFGIIFNNIHQVNGLIAGGQYYSAETLSDSQQGRVDTLVKKAYANWKDIVEYDDRMPLNMKQNKIAGTSQTKVVTGGPADYSVSFEQPAVSLPHLPPLIPSKQAIVNSGSSIRDNPVSFDQQAFVPHPSSTDTVPSSQPSMRQAIRGYPHSFHPQTSFQPFSVPSGQTSVNSKLAVGCIDQRVYPAFLTPVASPDPVLVNPKLIIEAPVPCQTPSVPSGEASENSMWDVEGLDALWGELDRFDSHLPGSSLDPPEQAGGNTVLSDGGLDALWREVDRADSHLPGSSLDPPEQAGGNTVLSVGADGGSFERGGGSNSPRIEKGIYYQEAGNYQYQRNMYFEGTKNLGNVKSEVSGTIYCERSGARPRLLGSNCRRRSSARRRLLGSDVRRRSGARRRLLGLLGSNARRRSGARRRLLSPLLSEREEFREMASPDSKFEGPHARRHSGALA